MFGQIFGKYSNNKFHKNPSTGNRIAPCGRTRTWFPFFEIFGTLLRKDAVSVKPKSSKQQTHSAVAVTPLVTFFLYKVISWVIVRLQTHRTAAAAAAATARPLIIPRAAPFN